jgi:hypothetical protein
MSECDFVPNKPIADPNLESRAMNFDRNLKSAFDDHGYNAGVIAAKYATQQFIDDSLKLPSEDQFRLFTRVQELNDRHVCEMQTFPALNFVFSDGGNKAGDRHTLAKVLLTPIRNGGSNFATPLPLELYER